MKRTDLPREVAAGLSLAALVIPLNIGYAQVAGVSPVVGLYAGILPLAVFALLTSSRHVVSSPNASMAALIVYRFGAPLYFANANLLVEQVEQLVTQPSHPVERFVLDAQAMVDIDTTGAEALKQVLDLLEDRNIAFAMSRASRSIQLLLRQYGLFERVTENRLHATNRQAIAAFS